MATMRERHESFYKRQWLGCKINIKCIKVKLDGSRNYRHSFDMVRQKKIKDMLMEKKSTTRDQLDVGPKGILRRKHHLNTYWQS